MLGCCRRAGRYTSDEVRGGRLLALRQRELLPVVIDHEICGAEEWHPEARCDVCIDAWETVDQDFDVGGAQWIFLSFGIDSNLGDYELVVGNCDFETEVD